MGYKKVQKKVKKGIDYSNQKVSSEGRAEKHKNTRYRYKKTKRTQNVGSRSK